MQQTPLRNRYVNSSLPRGLKLPFTKNLLRLGLIASVCYQRTKNTAQKERPMIDIEPAIISCELMLACLLFVLGQHSVTSVKVFSLTRSNGWIGGSRIEVRKRGSRGREGDERRKGSRENCTTPPLLDAGGAVRSDVHRGPDNVKQVIKSSGWTFV